MFALVQKKIGKNNNIIITRQKKGAGSARGLKEYQNRIKGKGNKYGIHKIISKFKTSTSAIKL